MDRDQLYASLRHLAGTSRVLIYDVPEEQAPTRSSPSTPFVHGGKAWWQFVERRRALDDGGDLNILVSMRGLRFDERLIVVGWGTAYANSFLVIEPADPWLDLTTREGLDNLTKQTGARNADALVRAAYAEWIYWLRDEAGTLESHSATLSLTDKNDTLWESIRSRLPQTFPASAFLSSLTMLTLRESELFTGGREVHRAIVPFLTRLGLPVLYDAQYVIDSVRQLVNVGLAVVQDPQERMRSYRGPIDPLPADVTNERLAMMVR